MLLWVCIRNVRRNFGKYLLAATGIGLAVTLVSASLAGIASARRIGVEPIRQVVGGDLMIVSGKMVTVPLAGGGWGIDNSAYRRFSAADVKARLAGIKVNESVSVLAYCETLGKPIALCGRTVSPMLTPRPIMALGRCLAAQDEGQPRIVRGQVGFDFGPIGGILRTRIPKYDPSTGQYDLAAGAAYSLELVGSEANGWGSDSSFVPFSFLAEATGTDLVDWLGIEVADYTRLEATAKQLRAALPEYTVLTAEQVFEAMDSNATEMRKSATSIITLVIGLGCIAVLNTFLLLTQMRRKEIALLKVLGLRPGEIVMAFVFEGLLVNLAGGCAGFVLGSMAPTGMGMPPSFSLTTFAWVISLVVAVTLVSLVFPAVWATRYSAMEVMRNV